MMRDMAGSPEISRDSAVLIEKKVESCDSDFENRAFTTFLCGFIKGKGDDRLEALILRSLFKRSPLFKRYVQIIAEQYLIVNRHGRYNAALQRHFFIINIDRKLI